LALTHYHSQHGEDLWILEHLQIPLTGLAAEVGAADGLECSNTLFFEQLGWRCLLIEADPRHHDQLRHNRPGAIIEPVACGRPGCRTFYQDPDPLIGGFERYSGKPLTVHCRSLGEILAQHSIERVDLLSIDTEGTELEVWESFDHATVKPPIVIIEHFTIGMAHDPAPILAAMTAAGYLLMHQTVCNFIFALPSAIPLRQTTGE
jgi:FkbM family methyltransferase